MNNCCTTPAKGSASKISNFAVVTNWLFACEALFLPFLLIVGCVFVCFPAAPLKLCQEFCLSEGLVFFNESHWIPRRLALYFIFISLESHSPFSEHCASEDIAPECYAVHFGATEPGISTDPAVPACCFLCPVTERHQQTFACWLKRANHHGHSPAKKTCSSDALITQYSCQAASVLSELSSQSGLWQMILYFWSCWKLLCQMFPPHNFKSLSVGLPLAGSNWAAHGSWQITSSFNFLFLLLEWLPWWNPAQRETQLWEAEELWTHSRNLGFPCISGMGIHGHSTTKNSAFSRVASPSCEKSRGFSWYLKARSTSFLVCTWLWQALPKAVTLLAFLLVAVIVLRTGHWLGKQFEFLSDFNKKRKLNKREKPYILVITRGLVKRNNIK